MQLLASLSGWCCQLRKKGKRILHEDNEHINQNILLFVRICLDAIVIPDMLTSDMLPDVEDTTTKSDNFDQQMHEQDPDSGTQTTETIRVCYSCIIYIDNVQQS